MDIVHKFFDWCVDILIDIGEITGMGYELANIVIFVFLQPALILLFFCLWIYAMKKHGTNRLFQKSLHKGR